MACRPLLPDEFPDEDPELLQARREDLFWSEWIRESEPCQKAAPKTTIDHLFISTEQLLWLTRRNPKESVTDSALNGVAPLEVEHNGHHERHAVPRVQVLMAAIYCFLNFEDRCRESNAEWARVIDEKAPLFWSAGTPPLGLDLITRLLGKAKTPNKL